MLVFSSSSDFEELLEFCLCKDDDDDGFNDGSTVTGLLVPFLCCPTAEDDPVPDFEVEVRPRLLLLRLLASRGAVRFLEVDRVRPDEFLLLLLLLLLLVVVVVP